MHFCYFLKLRRIFARGNKRGRKERGCGGGRRVAPAAARIKRCVPFGKRQPFFADKKKLPRIYGGNTALIKGVDFARKGKLPCAVLHRGVRTTYYLGVLTCILVYVYPPQGGKNLRFAACRGAYYFFAPFSGLRLLWVLQALQCGQPLQLPQSHEMLSPLTFFTIK